ncbi:hypothetical protein [Streptomyces paradoxus]|uniref:hypothetical protein n=1 Tax=Streptomyces paradoxus TaxID=66375 RepID=UPI0037D50BAC
MHRFFHNARKTAATAPVGRLAAGAVLALAAVGTLGAAQDLAPLAGQGAPGTGTSVRAAAPGDDPWTSAPAGTTDDPWTSAPKSLADDPWTSAPASAQDDPWT